MICDRCKHNRSYTDDIIVDGRVADRYEEWGCTHEDDLTENELELLDTAKTCRFFEEAEDDSYDQWLEDQYREEMEE